RGQTPVGVRTRSLRRARRMSESGGKRLKRGVAPVQSSRARTAGSAAKQRPCADIDCNGRQDARRPGDGNALDQDNGGRNAGRGAARLACLQGEAGRLHVQPSTSGTCRTRRRPTGWSAGSCSQCPCRPGSGGYRTEPAPHISPRVRGTQGKGAHREGSWMLKLLRALFLILGIPNAVLGLPLLVVWIQRSSSDAPLGLDALVPAGSAGLTLGLYFLLSLQLRVKGQEALDAVRRGEAFESGPNLIVPAAWAGLGVLVVAVVHATPAGQRALPVAFALLCLFLFAWLGWPGIRPMLRRGPVLRMDAEGIEHFRYGYIPWRVVAGISLEVQRLPRARWLKLHILWLGVRDAQRYLDRWPRATLI